MTPDDTCTSVRCLRATGDPKRCRCSCAGRLHGAIDDSTYVDALIEARRAGLHLITDRDLIEGIA